MNNRIHDARLVHQHYNRLCKSHCECRGEDSHRSLAEQLACLARTDSEDQSQEDSHDHVDRGDLRERPSKLNTAESLDDNDRKENQKSQCAAQVHLPHIRRMVFLSLIQILVLHKALFRIFPYPAAVDIETYKADHIEHRKPHCAEPDS